MGSGEGRVGQGLGLQAVAGHRPHGSPTRLQDGQEPRPAQPSWSGGLPWAWAGDRSQAPSRTSVPRVFMVAGQHAALTRSLRQAGVRRWWRQVCGAALLPPRSPADSGPGGPLTGAGPSPAPAPRAPGPGPPLCSCPPGRGSQRHLGSEPPGLLAGSRWSLLATGTPSVSSWGPTVPCWPSVQGQGSPHAATAGAQQGQPALTSPASPGHAGSPQPPAHRALEGGDSGAAGDWSSRLRGPQSWSLGRSDSKPCPGQAGPHPSGHGSSRGLARERMPKARHTGVSTYCMHRVPVSQRSRSDL